MLQKLLSTFNRIRKHAEVLQNLAVRLKSFSDISICCEHDATLGGC